MLLQRSVAWPIVAVFACCSVYDDSLLSGAGGSAGVGGSSAAGSSGSSAGGIAGSALGGNAGSGNLSATSGSSAVGGQAGAAFVPEYELIDDMEDGDEFVMLGTGRSGRWSIGSDGSGTTDPSTTPPPMTLLGAPDIRGTSLYAARLRAEGFASGAWGVFIAVTYVYPESPVNYYDGSAYCGIHFWAKRSADTTLGLSVRMPDKYSVPEGGFCREVASGAGGAGGVNGAGGEAGASPGICFDHFSRAVGLTETWKEYTVFFSDMTQGGWGAPSPLEQIDMEHLISIEFFMGKPAVFELWVDDLAFVKNATGGPCP